MEEDGGQTTADGAECLLSYAQLFPPSYNNESPVRSTVFACRLAGGAFAAVLAVVPFPSSPSYLSPLARWCCR